MRGKDLLYHVAEHGIHSPGSALGNLGGGSGSGPRSDPPESVMRAISIALVIAKLKDPQPLMDWIEEERGRCHAEMHIGDAQCYEDALTFQETRLDQIERTDRFIRALAELDSEMKRRDRVEREQRRRLGYDV